ncbi:MAG: repeat-containing protein YrrB [Verrucomicrobiales bacterium]|nr:repeat-containing protein YrrB [Verrucomicrobiales bacterium]
MGRKVFFALTLPTLLLLVVFAILELTLRFSGYGYPTTFFVPAQIDGQSMLVENPRFGLRFFPPALARSPAPTVMRKEKPVGVYRIFLFGESAAMGDPRPAYGMGRYLEALLSDRFPEMQFEVICVAMTAINSHVVLPIAHEVSQYQGDLWVIYMGNNEMVGPFGANTVFGMQAPKTITVRALLALQRTRTGQWLVAAARRFRDGTAGPTEWSGAKMFSENHLRPNDPKKEQVYANFSRNLEDIIEVGIDAHVPIVLSSVASNLKDFPPLASQHVPDLTPQDHAAWTNLMQRGTKLAEEKHWSEASPLFQQAAKLSPQFAETYFRLGESLLALTNADAARKNFQSARDLDALPFRADSRLNSIISETAQRFANRGVRKVDSEKALNQEGAASISGNESFLEHVHLTTTGNYRLARSLAAQITESLSSAPNGRQKPIWLQQEMCDQRLGFTDWNRYSIMEEILRRVAEPPFTEQTHHIDRIRQISLALSEIKERMHPRTFLDTRFIYEEALKLRPRDYWLHENFAEFLEATGELPAAALEWEKVRDLLPLHHLGYFQGGRLLARQKRYPEARLLIESALHMRPDLDEAYYELGQIATGEGKLDEALKDYAELQRRHPRDGRVPLRRADVLAMQGKRKEAIESLREAIRLRPSLYEAHYLLGVELAVDEKLPEAQAEFENVIRLRPDHALAHLNLGVALARQRRLNDAFTQFQATLQLDPENQKARQMLQMLEKWRNAARPESPPKIP